MLKFDDLKEGMKVRQVRPLGEASSEIYTIIEYCPNILGQLRVRGRDGSGGYKNWIASYSADRRWEEVKESTDSQRDLDQAVGKVMRIVSRERVNHNFCSSGVQLFLYEFSEQYFDSISSLQTWLNKYVDTLDVEMDFDALFKEAGLKRVEQKHNYTFTVTVDNLTKTQFESVETMLYNTFQGGPYNYHIDVE